MAEPIPHHFKIPQVEPYDGITNPLDHLASYKAHMMIQGVSDALYCLAFLATLKKLAQMWYSSLKPSIIHFFSNLERLFLSHFRTNQQILRTSDSLFLMQQRGDEPLRNFLTCFNAAAMEIPDLNKYVAMSVLKMGLKPSKLTFSIDKSSPKDYAVLLGKAHKYALAEEQAASRRQAEGKSAKKGNKATEA